MTRILFVSAFIVGSAMGLASGYAQSTDSSGSKCGPVAYDQNKQTYVGIPCPQGTTDENPAGRSQ